MGFRTVVIKSRAKLETRLNSLVIRGEQEKKIFLAEINTLIIQSTAVSLTASLMSELMKHNIKVIFCDDKHNPQAEVIPYYGAHNTSKRYKTQFSWKGETKAKVWKKIIRKKIYEQALHLFDCGFIEQSDLLKSYVIDVVDNDVSNREGHAAKVYFNCLLGLGNSRKDDIFMNACLNYGYSVLTSAFNREIVASGYLTQIGIWHDNEFNQFNLACDLMEPLRVVVDRTAYVIEQGDKDFKKKMANVLNYTATINDKNTTLDLAIKQYVKSVLNALESDDENLIVFPENIVKNEL